MKINYRKRSKNKSYFKIKLQLPGNNKKKRIYNAINNTVKGSSISESIQFLSHCASVAKFDSCQIHIYMYIYGIYVVTYVNIAIVISSIAST